MKPGNLSKLLVKVCSTPVQNTMNTSILEKSRMAIEMLVKFRNFKKIITSPSNDLKNEKIEAAK